MRIVIVAFALTVLGFLTGLVGDFSEPGPPRVPIARAAIPPIPPDAVRAHPLPPLRSATAEAAPQRDARAETRSQRRARSHRPRMTRMIAPVEKPVRTVSSEPKFDPLAAHKRPSKREILLASR